MTTNPERSFLLSSEEAMPDLLPPGAIRFVLADQKTKYGGRRLRLGDRVFVFASETQGGKGLCALGLVWPGRRLGRVELKPSPDWQDGRPETELNFKFYRQATNKLGGILAVAEAFLWAHF